MSYSIGRQQGRAGRRSRVPGVDRPDGGETALQVHRGPMDGQDGILGTETYILECDVY